ncbi:MAG: fumarylacetoacetate hydrolase family protein [Cutibacterium granulosum]|uniref:fumarylacetoacetate hydrolase family protein n=1 Tax=Cutibacterium granulosum TaxID=33011 RepID=UPI002B224F96|nr:fumarylacetoacetate hydrolase family protein [Cutibacterium granulosum]MEA5639694.1 fumarylacetoacetate hydrolase family protein [Cutibacterium granulosum]MEA5646799.1 fumarylacetoacetate hydrolase family protein [Cutibacterium granulosum]
MRIARYAPADGDPAFGIVELAADGGDHPDTIAQITGDPVAGPVQYTGARVNLADVRLLSPVIPRSKIIGVGRNYPAPSTGRPDPGSTRAAGDGSAASAGVGQGSADSSSLMTFLKPNTAVIGPDSPIVRPDGCTDLQVEGELAVVIGRICKDVPVERAQEAIFGFTVANDVTADGDWGADDMIRVKGSDTFCPLGPWMVTHFSVAEAGNVRLRTTVDGTVCQESSTSEMIRSVSELVSEISSRLTLLPGDVILTGTPAGAATVVPRQQVEVEIEGIGTLVNSVVAGQNAVVEG